LGKAKVTKTLQLTKRCPGENSPKNALVSDLFKAYNTAYVHGLLVGFSHFQCFDTFIPYRVPP